MIIVTGSIAYDYIMNFPGKYADHILPDKIHTINISFILDKFERRTGGTAGNVSYSLGLLKTSHILFSYAGKDFREYADKFKKLKIDLKNVLIDKKKHTATGFAIADKNNNQIWGYFYGAADNIFKLKLEGVANKNDLVLIGPSGAKGSMSFVDQCIKLKIPYMFDPGFILTQVTDNYLEKGIANAKYIIGNDYEINVIKKRVKKWKKYFKNKIIITTLGEKGAEIEENGKIYRIKSAKAKVALDPTGAGDAFRSGFLTGLEKRFDLKTCGQMGSIAAVYAVENYGCQEHVYTKEEFIKRYGQNYKTMLNL
ncbi:MAG TPA: PfkB family carbohydrate kinase [Patescibacteria group bacterium]|nr:PfkB family carbohydrate kinase [Patescibacteria group bacterium]